MFIWKCWNIQVSDVLQKTLNYIREIHNASNIWFFSLLFFDRAERHGSNLTAMQIWMCIFVYMYFLYFIPGKCLAAGFGYNDHAIDNIPGVCFKVDRVVNISLLVLHKVEKRDQDYKLPYYTKIFTNSYLYNLYFNL